MSEPSTVPKEEATEQPAKTVRTSGADAVVAALETAGVEHVFGVQGGAIMPVYDALYDSELTHVTMAHEQGAAHAADAYGIVTGKPGVCLATSGPGATNLLTGLADAEMDSDPLMALTGQVPTDFLGTNAFQETDTTGVSEPVTKTNYLAQDPNAVGDIVREAYAMARDGRPGPTLVDLPKDVTQADLEQTQSDRDQSHPASQSPTANANGVTEAANALARAERPVILSGGGVIKGDATNALRRFATTHRIPVVTTMPGLGSFPEYHGLALEVAGMHGTGYANLALQHCDVMLAVGCRFDDRLTGDVETFAPDAQIIHVDIDPVEMSKNVHAEYPLVGDAKVVLEQLNNAMPRLPDAAEWRQQCRQWKFEYSMDYKMDESDSVKPQFVVETLDSLTPSDTIVTTGVGQHQMWAMQYWTFRKPRTWVSSHGLGTMGYGLPAAIGAKVATDDQPVVCFDGDGSFLMTMSELAVAVREDLDITVVVLNNAAVGMVRQWQDAFFDERRMASDYSWAPQFDVLAESFGARGFRIDTPNDVKETLEAALAVDGPAVVDAHIDEEEDVYPMVVSNGDNGKFAMNQEQLDQL